MKSNLNTFISDLRCRAVDYNWLVDEQGGIRTTCDRCPIEAVAYAPSGHALSAAEKYGLHDDLILAIAHAADDCEYPDYHPENMLRLRNLLLTAVGLI